MTKILLATNYLLVVNFIASLALFLRAGYQREGLLRGNWKTHLGIRDSVILAKVRPGA